MEDPVPTAAGTSRVAAGTHGAPLWTRAALATLARAGVLVGTQAAAWRRHQSRADNRASGTGDILATGIRRLRAVVLARDVAEVGRRGGSTDIVGAGGHATGLRLIDQAAAGRVRLIGADGWRYYSRAFGSRLVALRYLCGTDDGRWAVRVPGTIDTAADALAWLVPAAVRDAHGPVLRQGDVYLVPSRVDALAAVHGTRHAWAAATRTLSHPEHASVTVAHMVRAVLQRPLAMRRGGRTDGD